MLSARHTSAAVLSIACAVAGGSAVAGEFSSTLALLSHYKWAGADQNFYEDKAVFPTAQASVFYSFDNGIYVGNWSSTIKFVDNNRIDSTHYLGYRAKLGPGVYDLSLGYNFYPGAAYANTTSVYAIYYWDKFAFKWTDVVSRKYVGLDEGRGRQAVAVEGRTDLTAKTVLKGEIGRLFLSEGLKRQGLANKVYYLVGLDYRWRSDISLGAALTGARNVPGPNTGYRNKSRLVASVTYAF